MKNGIRERWIDKMIVSIYLYMMLENLVRMVEKTQGRL
jgi:hypothetical protein